MTLRWIPAGAILLIALAPPKAFAFREYVPPQCEEQNNDINHPERYRECLFSLMRVESAEQVRARGDTAYRLLAIIDSLAMPIFIEFGHSPKGDTWLKLRSPLPDSRQVTMPITRERWSAINLRVQCKFPFTRPTTAREPTSLHKLGQLETTCIPQGGIDLEFIFRGQIIRGSIDPCDSKQGAFADFFFSRPFKLQVVVLAMIRRGRR